MEDAVRILGGGRLLAIRRVLAPLMQRSLVGAWLLVFIPATRELSTALFLYGPKTRTMSVMLMDMSEEGNFEQACTLEDACTCPDCHCKNTWGNYECTCKGNQLYIRGEDVCIGKATSFFSNQY